ncbi:MAG: sigma-70 family RNA polymerase sigma factor [Kofleriaceae bacterium]|nr:sigma-70 family RNA polymerase sigma factor [Kofleriaceae bacterium]
MVEERPPGEIEDISGTPPATPAPPPALVTTSDDAASTPSVTTAMRVALNGSMALFTVSVVAPVLMAAWAVVVAAGIGLGAFVLLHAGALEPGTLQPASAIGVVLALALAAGTLRLSAPAQAHPGEETYPAFATLIGLVVIAGLTTLAALPHSAFFPYPLTTIAVVAATTYLALAGLVAATRLTIALARGANRWGAGGMYRAGFLTATFLLLGAAGAVALEQRVYVVPLRAAASELEVSQVAGPSGVLDAAPRVLCLGAGEVAPKLARSETAAPACSFLPHSEERSTDECFEHLAAKTLLEVQQRLRESYGCDADCDDVAMKALIETCTRVPLAANIDAYFTTVAKNGALKWKREDYRTLRCSEFDDVPDDPCIWEAGEDDDEKVRAFSRDAVCRMTAFERRVVTSRLGERDEPMKQFSEVAAALGITETKARNTFHNTMRRLRKEMAAWRAECNIHE